MFGVIAAIIIYTLGLIIGYLLGKRNRDTTYVTFPSPGAEVIKFDGEKPAFVPNEPETTNNEGVGIVMRPSAEELKKMNEDETTRLNKEATAETFGRVGEPRI